MTRLPEPLQIPQHPKTPQPQYKTPNLRQPRSITRALSPTVSRKTRIFKWPGPFTVASSGRLSPVGFDSATAMLRRRHKKSRAGCLECKRRHVKCDERRPVCSLCSVSDRKCTFPVLSPSDYERTEEEDGILRLASVPWSPLQSSASLHKPVIVPALPVFPEPSRDNVHSAIDNDSPLLVNDTDTVINVGHAELIVHLMTSNDIHSLASSGEDMASDMALGLRIGIRTPYLLYALLAFSARHLSFLAAQISENRDNRPSSSSSSASPSTASSPGPPPATPRPPTPRNPPSTVPPCSSSSTPSPSYHSTSAATRYQRQAVLLQTRAISLFNASWRATSGVVDHSNCVPMLLFSSVLGHHLLADALSHRDDSIEQFLEHYIQCTQLQQGVYAIAMTTWPFLLVSEVAPILQWSARFTSRQGRGNDCQQLLVLIEAASADVLNTANKDACRQAIRLLQIGFDVLFLPAPKPDAQQPTNSCNDAMDKQADGTTTTPTERSVNNERAENAYRHKMIVLWPLIMSKEFANLLVTKVPEALVILAYYAWLLHHGRHLWQVGDAGVYIMHLVTSYLGDAWDRWLEYPRHRMATDVVEPQPP